MCALAPFETVCVASGGERNVAADAIHYTVTSDSKCKTSGDPVHARARTRT